MKNWKLFGPSYTSLGPILLVLVTALLVLFSWSYLHKDQESCDYSEQPPTCVTTRPPLPQPTTTTYLYLLYHPVFLDLILTVVIPQSCLCLHCPLPFLSYILYLTVVYHGAGLPEDDLLVQAVEKCSTSTISGRDWFEVAWEMSGRLPQQCQESHRLADILTQSTFVFLSVTFRAPHNQDTSRNSAPSPSVIIHDYMCTICRCFSLSREFR